MAPDLIRTTVFAIEQTDMDPSSVEADIEQRTLARTRALFTIKSGFCLWDARYDASQKRRLEEWRAAVMARAPLIPQKVRLYFSPIDDVPSFEILGRGKFGVVFKPNNAIGNQPRVAIKELYNPDLYFREIDMLTRVLRAHQQGKDGHNYLLKLHRGFEERRWLTRPEFLFPGVPIDQRQKTYYIATNYVSNTNLCQWSHASYQSHSLLTRNLYLYNLFATALRGLHLLKQLQIVHHDIKPQNILVQHVGAYPSSVIIDFGLACDASDRGRAACETNPAVGTPVYVSVFGFKARDMAELLANDASAVQFLFANDLWSLAVSFFEICTNIPFPEFLLGVFDSTDVLASYERLFSTPPLARRYNRQIELAIDNVNLAVDAPRMDNKLATALKTVLTVKDRPPSVRLGDLYFIPLVTQVEDLIGDFSPLTLPLGLGETRRKRQRQSPRLKTSEELAMSDDEQ